VPEIQRCELSSVALLLKAIGVKSVPTFAFMQPPPAAALAKALLQLYHLGALDRSGELTPKGKRMAELPLLPQFAAVLLSAVALARAAAEDAAAEFDTVAMQTVARKKARKHPVLERALTLVSMLSVDTVFHYSNERRAEADAIRKRFAAVAATGRAAGGGGGGRPGHGGAGRDSVGVSRHVGEGDHVMLVRVFEAFELNRGNSEWCHENFVNKRALKRASDVRAQLAQIVEQIVASAGAQGGGANSAGPRTDSASATRGGGAPPPSTWWRATAQSLAAAKKAREDPGSSDAAINRQLVDVLLGGCFLNAAELDATVSESNKSGRRLYSTLVSKQPVSIHPTSVLFRRASGLPQWVVYTELVMTSRRYIRCVTEIDPRSLVHIAPEAFGRLQRGR
jgi:ATP-dependent RNA helicase DHX8/PRP22